MSEQQGSPKDSNVSSLLLARIAKVLDRPVSDFTDPAICDLGQTSELLRLWISINGKDDRMKVLGFMRTVKDANNGS